MTTVGTVPETLDDSKTQASLQPAQVPPSPVSSQASGVLVQATKPVEALDWMDLATNPMVPYCNSCGQVVNQSVMTEAVRKKGHQKLMCQSCRSVTNMLYKRVNMSDLNFRDLDDDQACFFSRMSCLCVFSKTKWIVKFHSCNTKACRCGSFL